MTMFNCFFSIFISPLRFSFCAWNMKDDKGMEFWLSRFSPQPAPAQLSSLTPLLPSLLFPQLSRLLLQISFCCLATAPQAMSHGIAYYSFRGINRRGKILAVTLELLCTNAPKPGNSRADIIVEFCTMVPGLPLHG